MARKPAPILAFGVFCQFIDTPNTPVSGPKLVIPPDALARGGWGGSLALEQLEHGLLAGVGLGQHRGGGLLHDL
ncbi:MAG: hypothetical protein ACO24Y_13330, partial [Hylemonella sp.]